MFLAIGLGIGIGKIAQVENWYWNYYWKNHFQYYWYWNCYCKNSFQHYWYWYWSQNFGIDHLWSMVDELTIATVLLLVDPVHFRKYEACLGPILKHF